MRCSRYPTTTADAASRSGSSARGSRCERQSAQPAAAGARTKERRATTVDPELAARVETALRTLTGFEAKVRSTGVHVAADGEVQLEELAESLERLVAFRTA